MKHSHRKALEALLERRQRIFSRRSRELGEAAPEVGPEPDWTDLAAGQSLAGDLGRLTDLQLHELGEIEAALQRMEAGTYGLCEECERPIEPLRLEVLPTARECFICAEIAEGRRRPLRR